MLDSQKKQELLKQEVDRMMGRQLKEARDLPPVLKIVNSAK
jgi:hypothetical protein